MKCCAFTAYGVGFAWEPRTLTVEVGDTINWQWSIQTSGYEFGVHQSPNITATETKTGGFSSGPQSASGLYFNTVHAKYMSGYICLN